MSWESGLRSRIRRHLGAVHDLTDYKTTVARNAESPAGRLSFTANLRIEIGLEGVGIVVTIHVWSSTTEEMEAGPLTGHTDRFTSVAFSPDCRRIVSSSDDRTIRV